MATKKQLFSTSRSSSGSMAPWLGIAAIILLIDQLTKIVILKTFVEHESKTITSFFNLALVYNPGASFGFLGDAGGWQRWFFTAIAIGAVVFILYLLRQHATQRLFCWALSLILGGAIGNVIDRIAYGKVVDFLDFHYARTHFPTFNVADIAISIGAILFIYDELRRVKQH
jgi:signal peptidase II